MELWTNKENIERINPVSLLLPTITGGAQARGRYSLLDSAKPTEMFNMIVAYPLKCKCE